MEYPWIVMMDTSCVRGEGYREPDGWSGAASRTAIDDGMAIAGDSGGRIGVDVVRRGCVGGKPAYECGRTCASLGGCRANMRSPHG